MSEVVEFTVPAMPVAQPAKQVRIAKTKDGRAVPLVSTPEKHPVQSFKATCAMAARSAHPGAPLDGPLQVAIQFIFQRGGKPAWITKHTPFWLEAWKGGCRVPYAVKKRHDRDNLMKSLQDALNGIVWADDGLICCGPVEKWIAASDEQPHVWVRVEKLTGRVQS